MNGLLAAENQERSIGDARSFTLEGGETNARRNSSCCVSLLPEMNGRKPFSEGPGGGRRGGVS